MMGRASVTTKQVAPLRSGDASDEQ
jgi:hypothetical protein